MTDDVYGWARDKAEAEYFAYIEKLPTITPQYPQSSIISSNELDLTRIPF